MQQRVVQQVAGDSIQESARDRICPGTGKTNVGVAITVTSVTEKEQAVAIEESGKPPQAATPVDSEKAKEENRSVLNSDVVLANEFFAA